MHHIYQKKSCGANIHNLQKSESFSFLLDKKTCPMFNHLNFLQRKKTSFKISAFHLSVTHLFCFVSIDTVPTTQATPFTRRRHHRHCFTSDTRPPSWSHQYRHKKARPPRRWREAPSKVFFGGSLFGLEWAGFFFRRYLLPKHKKMRSAEI